MVKETAAVLHIWMPFASLVYPSLALAMFKAALTQRGISSEVLYLNGVFARRIGVARYYNLVEKSFHAYGNMVGESIFAGAVNEGWSPQTFDAYLADLIKEGTLHDRMYEGDWKVNILEEAAELRREVEPFLNDCLAEVYLRRPRVVAFSTMISHQLPASLALAKRIKIALPDTMIVFGGADCQRPRGRQILAAFPFVDAVVEGEGDLVYPEMVSRVLAGKNIEDIQGMHRQTDSVHSATRMQDCDAPRVSNLDELPIPDYSEYVEMMEGLVPELDGVDEKIRPVPFMLVETSRGCWWSAAGWCNFCAEDHAKGHRKKTPARVVEEFSTLQTRYHWRHFWMTDSAMPPDYPRNVMPLLANQKLGIDISYFVRANLTKNDLRTMHRAGVLRVMPGIETFSGHLLDLLNKGTDILQNVQLLKWCREIGISAEWNMLWAIPGESGDDYREIVELFPLLSHLQPPGGFLPVTLMRQSNYHARPEHFGLQNVAPLDGYRLIYQMDAEKTQRFATHFTFEAGLHPEEYLEELIDATMRWRAPQNNSVLYFVDEGSQALVLDTRVVAVQQVHVLSSLQRCIILACDQAHGVESIVSFVKRASHVDHSRECVAATLQNLVERRLVICERDRFLALVVDAGRRHDGRIRNYIRACLAGGEISRGLTSALRRVRVDMHMDCADIDKRELADTMNFHLLNGARSPDTSLFTAFRE